MSNNMLPIRTKKFDDGLLQGAHQKRRLRLFTLHSSHWVSIIRCTTKWHKGLTCKVGCEVKEHSYGGRRNIFQCFSTSNNGKLEILKDWPDYIMQLKAISQSNIHTTVSRVKRKTTEFKREGLYVVALEVVSLPFLAQSNVSSWIILNGFRFWKICIFWQCPKKALPFHFNV